MHFNFTRVSGSDWYKLIKRLRRKGLTFLEVESKDFYNLNKNYNPFVVYFNRTATYCKIIYREIEKDKFVIKLREINFSSKKSNVGRAVIAFRKIQQRFDEMVDYEPNKKYTNTVFSYFERPYEGLVTVLDMNSAYLHALRQPLPDHTTQTKIDLSGALSGDYDYISFENKVHTLMVHKNMRNQLIAASLFENVEIYGYKAKVFYEKTAKQLYKNKVEIDSEFWKNVANFTVGTMHKRSGKKNNTTIAAGIYAWMEYYFTNLIEKFKKKGYHIIMVNTDSIKVKGFYNKEDNLVVLGNNLGEFSIEYVGESKYISEGHYEEDKVYWKGKPRYLHDGRYKVCTFIENLEEEKEIYEKFAIV